MTTTQLPSLDVGDPAPDFSLVGPQERLVSLSDFHGKYVVLYFYPKDDTQGCTREAQDFSALAKEFLENETIVLGVSPDSVKSHAKFIEKYGLNVLLLADPDKQAIKSYGVWAEKSMYGKTYMGVARTTLIIRPDGKIARVFRNVRVPEHARDVFAFIDEERKSAG